MFRLIRPEPRQVGKAARLEEPTRFCVDEAWRRIEARRGFGRAIDRPQNSDVPDFIGEFKPGFGVFVFIEDERDLGGGAEPRDDACI